MGTDGLRFRQVVVVDELADEHWHEDDNESLSPRAAIPLGCSRAVARGPILTPPPPHSPFNSSPNHHESAIPVNDGNLEERNCPSPLNTLSPPTTSGSGLSPDVCDGAPGPSTGPPLSRGSLEGSEGLVTGDHLSYDATIEERQRIFGHNVLPPCARGGYPSENHLLLIKEITSAIVSTCKPSIHSDPSV